MFDDISFLVQETFKDAENKQHAPSKGLFSNFFGKQETELPDEVPGLFYNLQKKASTFVIRIHPSQNLREDYQNILKHPDLYPTLRLNEEEGELEEKLQFFECDLFHIAQNVRDQLGNKRFPIFEEHIFNVSDPGDSWWLKNEDNKMTIYFKLSRTENMDSLIKLGPIGDTKTAMENFNGLYGYFKLLFPVSDYSSAHGQFSISTNDENNFIFSCLKSLMESGETDHDFWEYLRQLEMKSQNEPYIDALKKANYYLMELSVMRRFWKTIEGKIKEE